MSAIPEFGPDHARRLEAFLAGPGGNRTTLGYLGLSGFLFAVACSPELIPPSEWLAVVQEEAPDFSDQTEAEEVLLAMLALHNTLADQVSRREPEFPPGCRFRDPPLANLDEDAPLRRWAAGFVMGHDWLADLWDARLPQELDEELGAVTLALGFFAGREFAEAFHREASAPDTSLEQMAGELIRVLPDALASYANIARAVQHEAVRRRTPARSRKVPRNAPCPCGSGRKYKKCCGAGTA